MNEHDLNNLKFLLSASPIEMGNWFKSTNDDDHLYACEILEQAKSEMIDMALIENPDFSQADAILKQFQLC